MNTKETVLYLCKQHILQEELREAKEKQDKAFRYLVFLATKGNTDEIQEED